MKTALLEAVPFQLLETGEVNAPGGGERLMKVRGVMQRAGERNGNGRIYPKPLLQREVTKLAERLKTEGSIFSQADHPADGRARISDTAAMLKSIEIKDDGTVIGEAVILPTSKGKDLAAIIRAGGKVGISARGYGNVAPGEVDGVKGDVVQEDYSLVTYDFVIGQSHKGAVISSFEEQAQALGTEEVAMKEITLEKLKAERPDLVTAIEEAVMKGLTVESIKTARPELVEAMTVTCPECGKKFTAKESEEATEEQKATKREKLVAEHCKAKKLVLVEENDPDAAVKAEVGTLKALISEQSETLKKQEASITSLTERAQKADLLEAISSKTEGKPHRVALMEELKAKCKKAEEVEAALPIAEQHIASILEGDKTRGNGSPGKNEEPGSQELGEQKKVKLSDGREITEAQAAQRKAAGLPL